MEAPRQYPLVLLVKVDWREGNGSEEEEMLSRVTVCSYTILMLVLTVRQRNLVKC